MPSKPTPGPWTSATAMTDPHTQMISPMGYAVRWSNVMETRANARLMAASPDLQAAIICMLTDIRDIGHVGPKTTAQAQRALKKSIEGQQP